MSLVPTSNILPEKLRETPLYPKITAMMDYIVTNIENDFKDVKYKFSGPSVVRNEVVSEIIVELGFSYISEVMSTITNYEFNKLLEFLGLINLLKGSREGLDLVLKLLGLDSIITEWWETDPKGPVDTYGLIVIMNTSTVEDVFATLDKVRVFAAHYVYPILTQIDYRFKLPLAEKNVNIAGISRVKFAGTILQRAV